jgi:2-polyprenyl-6-methoxyphenol hydroxylase-like FAD-dependent oxidoreductase
VNWHVGLDRSDFVALFPLKEEGRVRLVGTVSDQALTQRKTLAWEDVNTQVLQWMPVKVAGVNWFSTYHVHHRVADHFRSKRAFLLGDAAHIHSPVGGQGMNTGIGDAVNLAWKLAWVLQDRADESILESYEPERIAFARRLVETTDQAFTAVTSSKPIARFLRLAVVPAILPWLFSLQADASDYCIARFRRPTSIIAATL